ncbi:MAG: hypothetical protein K5985_08530 [Lachnospiraceae bacterium]|nr:hypothetical protein [Lachnospiraceae bacterium]
MSKRKGKRRISSEAKTCFTFAIVFLIAGISCIIYGRFFYHSSNMVNPDEIKSGQTATVISAQKRERNLSYNDKEREKKKGYSDDEIRWEYQVVYSVDADGKEYTYEDVLPYRDDGKFTPHEGDTEIISYAVVNGEFIPNPETRSINGTIITGGVLIILAVIATGIGLFIRK